ncbi:unnamed protein product [Didymodactylos carnosus]|uniref:Uncharacterized protein n=1 Tax=Didymodactylos carnosus TaxID=1234261 RepID=A0A813T6H1_9BILA|nr:unnamed protein product [Didymodactylos carnosus]CAF0808196.1 unnamed protein product [Didymodactylos carnosus]CAF3494564.1 unnamed protein product [Didymodactylos carnosus]CAF3593699.1 unnamed protein product [Didymodactylos carnosus]
MSSCWVCASCKHVRHAHQLKRTPRLHDYIAMTFVLKWRLILKFSNQKICLQQKLIRTISNAKLHEVGIFSTLKPTENYETGQVIKTMFNSNADYQSEIVRIFFLIFE